MLSAVCARGGGHAPHVPRGAARRLHAQAQRGPGQRRLCEPVLQLFDRQYSEELGPLWTTAREVLCQPQCWQYAVMLNRFCASAELQPRLRALGYSGLLPPASSPLRCFVHPAPLRLPSQRHRPGQLKPYFLLNAASLLPVLALGAADGESVLDLCSAPGGKAVAVMQSATPGLLLCNEWDGRRWKWLAETLESFIPARFSHAVQVSNRDGRVFGRIAEGLYDKVLVDAPCSNDRSWLFCPGPDRGAERIRGREALPELQTQLLRSAVAALRPGGALVYSTCTLSRAENGAVVEALLRSCPSLQLEDLGGLADSLAQHFTFAPPAGPGLLVVPDAGRTWGPMFVAKMRKLH
ncbi:tRNA (cytosine(34)-C(5))-methyltransferase, mitochondrial isoform X1 [Amia ocellicauda]|uniref:tRNA (cytosine(34)-C(5))-methyltransferase, mitochondrial isoform X1 n=1 Tax=Amia ocellicauda TaxID=2972642 RepID=UPI003464DC85